MVCVVLPLTLCHAGAGGLNSGCLTLFSWEKITVCEITDSANAYVMTGGNVSRFRIESDSTVP